MRAPAAIALCFLCVEACDDPSPRARFAAEVAPALVRRCGTSSCHAVDARGASPRRLRFRVDRNGEIADDAMDDAYGSARQFINTTELPELSSLLRKAAPPSLGAAPAARGIGRLSVGAIGHDLLAKADGAASLRSVAQRVAADRRAPTSEVYRALYFLLEIGALELR